MNLKREGAALVVEAIPVRDGKAMVTVRARDGGSRLANDTIAVGSKKARTKFVEDLPEGLRAEALEHLEDLAEPVLSASRSGNERTEGQGSAVTFPEVKPWQEPVDGAGLLTEIEKAIREHVIVSEHAARAIALWVVATHAVDLFEVAGILCLCSPTKRCGKSTAQRILKWIVRRPFPVVNVSAAFLFRLIERDAPTLLLDEADSWKENEDLRGLLDAGISREDAFAGRLVGDDHEPRRFSVYGPKAIALIGKLPDTLEDRSIVVRMERKKRGEKIRRLRKREAAERFGPMVRKIVRWVEDHHTDLTEARPEPLEALNDRAADIWEPLIAIADVAGGDWPERARQAAIALSGDGAMEDGSVAVLLLGDLRDALAEREVGRISSVDFAEGLSKMEERPWGAWDHGRPVTANQIARLLRGFGVRPKAMRIDGGPTVKGYDFESCRDAFERYLTGSDVSNGNGVTRRVDIDETPTPQVETCGNALPIANDGFGASVSQSYRVTDETLSRGDAEEQTPVRGDAWEPPGDGNAPPDPGKAVAS